MGDIRVEGTRRPTRSPGRTAPPSASSLEQVSPPFKRPSERISEVKADDTGERMVIRKWLVEEDEVREQKQERENPWSKRRDTKQQESRHAPGIERPNFPNSDYEVSTSHRYPVADTDLSNLNNIEGKFEPLSPQHLSSDSFIGDDSLHGSQPPTSRRLSSRRSSTSSNERDVSFYGHRPTLSSRTFVPKSRVSRRWASQSYTVDDSVAPDETWGPLSLEDDISENNLTTRLERQNSATSIRSTGSLEMRRAPWRREASYYDDYEDGIRRYAHRPLGNIFWEEIEYYQTPLQSLSPSQTSSRRSSLSSNERDYLLYPLRPTLHSRAPSSPSRGSDRDSMSLSIRSSPGPEVWRPSSFENDTALRPASTELGQRVSTTNSKSTGSRSRQASKLAHIVQSRDWTQTQQAIRTRKLNVAQSVREQPSLTNEEERSQVAKDASLRMLQPEDTNRQNEFRAEQHRGNAGNTDAPKKPSRHRAYLSFLEHIRADPELALEIATSKWWSMSDAERQAYEEGLNAQSPEFLDADFSVRPERSFKASGKESDNEYDSDGHGIYYTTDSFVAPQEYPPNAFSSLRTSRPLTDTVTRKRGLEERSSNQQPSSLYDRENRESLSSSAISWTEVRRKEKEVKRREEEAMRKEEKAKRKEEDLLQREADLKTQKQAMKAREAELESLAASTRRFTLHSILVDAKHYRLLLKCTGQDAQILLDYFQSLLDNDGFSERGKLLVAMQRLSAKTELYPLRYVLDGPISLIDDHPVNAGRFADIYKAEFRGELTCFKVIRAYGSHLVQHMAKIYAREAILWGQLCHPNLLPFYGLYMFRSQLAFVAPWADNGNLTDYLARVPNANRVLLCADTSAGIEYLHANDVVHGDLKALNVLVDGSGRACLSDFGLSGVTDKDIVQWATQSSTSSKGGTTRWQAPELHDPEIHNIRNTKESDIFAWASTCYEIFTGNPPFFEVQRETTVAFRIFRGDLPTRPHPDDLSWKERGLTEVIWQLLVDCWSARAPERPDITSVILRLDSEKSTHDPRPPGQWQGGLAMRFRNAQEEENAEQKRVALERLDAILSKVMDGYDDV